MALTYATSPRGACHERGMVRQETFGAPPHVDPLATEGKAAICIASQNFTTMEDCLGFCALGFGNGSMTIESVAKACSGVWGVSVTEADILQSAERVWNLERMFNVREGFTRTDDVLPKRFLTEPHAYGPAKGSVVEMDVLLDDYYQERGWDMDGIPLPGTLDRLGLNEIL